jgi:hypothetical protein
MNTSQGADGDVMRVMACIVCVGFEEGGKTGRAMKC